MPHDICGPWPRVMGAVAYNHWLGGCGVASRKTDNIAFPSLLRFLLDLLLVFRVEYVDYLQSRRIYAELCLGRVSNIRQPLPSFRIPAAGEKPRNMLRLIILHPQCEIPLRRGIWNNLAVFRS